MEDVKAQLALLTRVVTDLQKVVLELKAEISALRSQSSLPKAVEPLKAVEIPPATATSGPEIPDEPWTDAEAKTQAPCGSTGKQLVKTPKIVAETDLTSREKVELFAGLFAGRSDVYATRWASRTDAQKSGYSPKCTMRYTEGCSLKCHLCPHRAYEKVTAGTYYFHLKGDIVMSVTAKPSSRPPESTAFHSFLKSPDPPAACTCGSSCPYPCRPQWSDGFLKD
mgnify:CR=1 FL=1